MSVRTADFAGALNCRSGRTAVPAPPRGAVPAGRPLAWTTAAQGAGSTDTPRETYELCGETGCASRHVRTRTATRETGLDRPEPKTGPPSETSSRLSPCSPRGPPHHPRGRPTHTGHRRPGRNRRTAAVPGPDGNAAIVRRRWSHAPDCAPVPNSSRPCAPPTGRPPRAGGRPRGAPVSPRAGRCPANTRWNSHSAERRAVRAAAAHTRKAISPRARSGLTDWHNALTRNPSLLRHGA